MNAVNNALSHSTRQLILLRGINMVPFAIFLSSLNLLLTHHGFSPKLAADETGIFFAMYALASIIGGYLITKLINGQQAYNLANIVQTLAMLLLAIANSPHFILIALSFYSAGLATQHTLTLKAINITTSDDYYRRRAMLYAYVAMNTAAILAFATSFVFFDTAHRHLLFLLGSAFPLLSNWLYNRLARSEPAIHHLDRTAKNSVWTLGLLILISAACCFALLYFENSARIILLILLLVGIGIFCVKLKYTHHFAFKSSKGLLFLIYFIACTGYFSIFNLNTTLLYDLIPLQTSVQSPQLMMLADPIIAVLTFVFAIGVVKSLKGTKLASLTTPILFIIAFILLLTATKTISSVFTHTHHTIELFVLYIALLTLGEVFISPEGFSLTGKLVAPAMMTYTIGLWRAFLGAAFLLSTVFTDHILRGHINANAQGFYHGLFFWVIALLILFALMTCSLELQVDQKLRLLWQTIKNKCAQYTSILTLQGYQMPKGVINLYIINATVSIGFGVLLSSLDLYLEQQGLPIREADTLTASFFALNFVLHFVSGTLGGGLISYRNLFFFSVSLQFLGLLGISAPHINIILIGMTCFLTGSGLNLSCINMMLTQRFKVGDPKRQAAFSINYACMNLGFLVSFLLTNIFQAQGHYHTLYLIATGFLFITLVVHILNWRHVPDQGTYFANIFSQRRIKYFAAPIILLLCFISILYLIHHTTIASALIYILLIVGIGFILRLARKADYTYRGKLFAYMILIAASMVYAFIQGLMATALQNFIEFNTTHHLLGLYVDSGGINSADNIGILIFGFILAKVLIKKNRQGKSIKPETLVASGLGFNILAFLMIPLGIWLAQLTHHTLVPTYFPFILLLFAAAAEIQVNATNYAMAGHLGKAKHQGLLTGYLFLNFAVGVNLAGPFSNLIVGQYKNLSIVSASQTNPAYLKMFLFLTIIVTAITAAYCILKKPITRLSNRKTN